MQNTTEDQIELEDLSTDLTMFLEDETRVGLESLKLNQVIGQGAFGLVRQVRE